MGTSVVRRSSGHVTALAIFVGMVASGTLVWKGSQAAFTAETHNATNTWSSGRVVLDDDDSNGVMFQITDMKPGAAPKGTGEKCIKVTYTGDINATVKLYTKASSYNNTGGLGTYVNLKIEQGTAADYSSCASFDPDDTVYVVGQNAGVIFNGTVDGFSAKTNHSNGVGSTGAWAANDIKVYKFTWTLQDTDNAQDRDTAIGFTWQAQST